MSNLCNFSIALSSYVVSFFLDELCILDEVGTNESDQKQPSGLRYIK
jgi:hypothetical protein